VNDRTKKLLDALGSSYVRTEPVSTCPGEKDCSSHPGSPKGCKGATYTVFEGDLKGIWSAWGDDAELIIFDRMNEALDEKWKAALKAFGVVADAQRAVGK
jgi:hypothetical protein